MRTQLQLASLLRAHYLPEKMVRMQRLQELRQFQAPLPLQPRNLGKALHPQRQGRVYQVHMNAHGKHWLGCWVTWWSWAPWLKTRMIVKTRKRTVMMTMMLMTMEARRSQKRNEKACQKRTDTWGELSHCLIQVSILVSVPQSLFFGCDFFYLGHSDFKIVPAA